MQGFVAIMVAALVGVLGLGACGSSGGSALTKSEFITQADAICKKYDDQLNASATKLGNNATQDQVIALIKSEGIPGLQSSHDQIAKLKPPKEDEAQIKTLLDDLQTGIDATKKQLDTDPQAALASNDAGPLAQAGKDAAAYGFKECGATADSSSSGDGSSPSSTP